MTTKRSWSASSKPEEPEDSDTLVDLAGRWNIGIDVRVTNPHTYSQDPVKVRMFHTFHTNHRITEQNHR